MRSAAVSKKRPTSATGSTRPSRPPRSSEPPGTTTDAASAVAAPLVAAAATVAAVVVAEAAEAAKPSLRETTVPGPTAAPDTILAGAGTGGGGGTASAPVLPEPRAARASAAAVGPDSPPLLLTPRSAASWCLRSRTCGQHKHEQGPHGTTAPLGKRQAEGTQGYRRAARGARPTIVRGWTQGAPHSARAAAHTSPRQHMHTRTCSVNADS
jgi:hypothetical protein